MKRIPRRLADAIGIILTIFAFAGFFLIAWFDFFRMDAEGTMHPAYAGVAAPSFREGRWTCDVITCFFGSETVRSVYGNDSLQSLGTALFELRKECLAALERHGAFFYAEDDVDPLTEESLSHLFPIPGAN